jgi:hypothetical protein
MSSTPSKLFVNIRHNDVQGIELTLSLSRRHDYCTPFGHSLSQRWSAMLGPSLCCQSTMVGGKMLADRGYLCQYVVYVRGFVIGEIVSRYPIGVLWTLH